mmetsp:Transcript_23014/g.55458  ORF Transcript_23014/g.55458 Transcript_23014/m.55458 type:complete len:321 (-) Transcript_23014:184-1146(-)|eukprot:CAMPEP_0181108672 /NCGR_PEP_ID=MMETSP1071-20121207/17757_1 /TAXON_ID=35127 /ORGANISM="Thalassiosira sp., Strain NH16" /LENGTH=320 /DNA_ID=CAMNT_0023192295 /DNA_START=86 /DNA_END=1048 /DNA_ORIENTATION=+
MTTIEEDNKSSQPNTSPPSWTNAAVGADDDKKDTKTDDDDDGMYIPSSAFACPPLVRLQAYGFCCPFLETEEEHDARVGVNNLQNYPITWYRKKLISDMANDVKGHVPNASHLIDGIGQLFGGSSTKGNNGKKHSGKSIPMGHVGVPSTMTIVDTDDHGPIIQIRTLDGWNDPSNPAAQRAVSEYMTSGKPWWENPEMRDKAPSKVIPLYMVDKVVSGWSLTSDATAGGVKLHAVPPSKGFLSGSGPELLRFDTLGGGGNTFSDSLGTFKPEEPNKYSDKVIVQLKSLVDWNRRRMAKGIKRGMIEVAPKATSPGYVAMA